jgi:hypothetical protein
VEDSCEHQCIHQFFSRLSLSHQQLAVQLAYQPPAVLLSCTLDSLHLLTLLGFRYFSKFRTINAWIFYATKLFLSQPHISSFKGTTYKNIIVHLFVLFNNVGYRQPTFISHLFIGLCPSHSLK